MLKLCCPVGVHKTFGKLIPCTPPKIQLVYQSLEDVSPSNRLMAILDS